MFSIENSLYTVKHISFTQARLQKIAIAGASGSGKTTLLKLIGGLLQPDEGAILFEGKKVRGPNDQLIPGHAGIAYLSQHFELRNNYRVHEILSYANELSQQEADTLYRVCRIDHLLSRRTDQLSGGEKQRIALARLLIGAPRLLLLDEPFSNLDAVHKAIIRTVVDDINEKLGISCILVSHDAPDTLPWADTILVLNKGEIIQQGSPQQVYRQPVNEYCAGLFGACNLLNPEEAALLLQVPIAAEKRMLVRPEQWTINAGAQGLAASVKKISFMGGYYSIEAVAGLQTINIKSATSSFALGETISLALKNKDAWFL